MKIIVSGGGTGATRNTHCCRFFNRLLGNELPLLFGNADFRNCA